MNERPVISAIGNNGPVCEGTTLNLSTTVEGGTSPIAYAWSGPGSYSSTNEDPSIGAIALTGTLNYTLVATDDNGCTATGTNTTAVTVNPLATPGTISGSGVVCEASTTSLTASGTTGGVWSSTNTDAATVSASGVVTGIAVGSTTISYTVTNGCGAVAATKFVTVNPLAIPSVISGTVTACAGATTQLTASGAGGGVWSSTNTAVATVSATGLVAGISGGTTTISYTLTNSCNAAAGTKVVTINALPNVSAGAGTAICPGTSAVLTATGATTYNWAPSTGLSSAVGNPVTASPTVTTTYTITGTLNGCNNTGTVTVTVIEVLPVSGGANTAICPGSATGLTASGASTYTWSPATGLSTTVGSNISASPAVTTTYTVIGTSGACSNTATVTVSVNAVAAPGTISGTAVLCAASTTNLTASGAGGGVWSSTNTTVATVSASGVVAALAAGTTTVSYTVTNVCGAVAAIAIVTVNPLPAPGTIAGSTTLCPGTTSNLTTSGTGGGIWSSTNTSVATISATGVVAALTDGSTTISYTVTNGCGTAAATTAVSVNSLPSAPNAITGAAEVCVGNNITLANTSSGGVWSSSNTAKATISASGVVTGLSPAVITISYTLSNSCGSLSSTHTLSVNATPSSISGTLFVCPGVMTPLTATPGGGLWSTPDATVTITASNGKVTGVTPGTATIIYTLGAGACNATTVVTVTPPPGSISGPTTLCPETSGAFTATVSGGTWSSSSPLKASIDENTGAISAISPGISVITYMMPGGCFHTTTVTINASPDAITGALTACPGNSTDLNSLTAGGVWTSSNTAIATVNAATGLVTSVAGVGTTTISYTITGQCPRSVVVTVAVAVPNVGTPVICVGQPFSVAILSNPTPGGTWSSSNLSKVIINSTTGILKGMATGTAVVTYHLDGACFSTSVVTVNPAVAAITGSAGVCPAASISLGNTTPGGTWSSSNLPVATIGTGGSLTGIYEGTTTVSYIVNEGCYTSRDITVFGIMEDITGPTTICQGSTGTLVSGPAGGTWSSAHATATANMTTGVVTGVSAGTARITYRNSSSGCFTLQTITITPAVAAITGTANVCPGATITLANADAGGTWTSSNTAKATIDVNTGAVTGIASGTSIITYWASAACYKTTIQSVNANPANIGGTLSVCQAATTALTSTAGGVWSSSNTAAATISAAGMVAGISPGLTTIGYVLPTGCTTSAEVTVNAVPSNITGTSNVCILAATTLSSTPSGGVWSSSNTVKASVDAGTGVVTGLTQGTSNITYTTAGGCFKKATVIVNPLPVAITGATTVATGAFVTLGNTTPSGTWSSSNTAIATVPATPGKVTGISAGVATITYRLTTTGCFVTRDMTVFTPRPGSPDQGVTEPMAISIYPNPSNGALTIETPEAGTFVVYSIDAKEVARYEVLAGVSAVSLPNTIAAGVYMCRFTGADGNAAIVRLVYER